MSRIVKIETSLGNFELELYVKHCPKTCQNFIEHCRQNYYKSTVFHRVIRDFMIQGGDPTGTGRGGQSIFGEHFEDEISPELHHVGAGILSMANSGPNTNGSQFFITLAPCQWLDGKHTIFGRVSSGLEVIDRIGKVSVDNSDRPEADIIIRNTTVLS